MISHKPHILKQWVKPVSLILAVALLIACEKDNETQSVVAPENSQQSIQSSGISLTPMPTQVGAPSVTPPTVPLLNSDNPQEISMLADSYFESQRYTDAIALYEKAISLNPRDADSMNDLGLAYFYVGQPGKALASLSNATTADPGYQHAWLSTGYILLSLQHYDEAVAPLQKARDLDPMGAVGKEAERFLKKIQEMKSN